MQSKKEQTVLYRKIAREIENNLRKKNAPILLVDGARQVGKTFIIREVGKRLFSNFIELNMVDDSSSSDLFRNVNTIDDFYFQVSSIAGSRMKEKDNTLIFIDEIQEYPHLLTLLKFLRDDNRFTYIVSGSQLGIALSETTSIPIGSIERIRMYPLDFEEFLLANGYNEKAISRLEQSFRDMETLDEATHDHLMDLFRKYLLVGGLPQAVSVYLESHNIAEIRRVHNEIRKYYEIDASKYDRERKLNIRRIYSMIPSNMENKKKRIVIKDIENKKGKTAESYQSEFEYLISSGIANEVMAVSNPHFPLGESSTKNLLKLYMNDPGLLTSVLYRNNIRAVLDDERSINLGAVYETAAACELKAHGFSLFYYDNKSKGEVDFLIDDYDSLSLLPLEIKSGRDYSIHSALNTFTANPDYNVRKAYVLSNNRDIKTKGNITYIPIYNIMFIKNQQIERLEF